MLRVEASNLPNPRGVPRSRRLLPSPPGSARSGASKTRHEMLPPPEGAPAEELTVPRHARPVRPAEERWSVRLELADDDIAKLYGQGMTRGAVVWKKGMEEWRPLLITPELSGLLRRTRTTLTELPDLPTWPSPDAPLVLPPPPRLPSSLPPPATVVPRTTEISVAPAQPTTVAPMAMDVAEAPSKARRPIELVAVAVAAFALAWIGHAKLGGKTTVAAPPAPRAVAAAAAPQCEPPPAPPARSQGSSIPTVSVADLPLAGARAATPSGVTPANVSSRASLARASSNDSGPSRAALVSALGQVARSASGCGERGGPVRVVMTFAGSGVARSIQVSGQDLPSATKSCIIGAASRARVPAFSGDPVTVSKTL